MTNSEPGNGKNRDELVQRLELMEAMVAEGRRYTGRNSWIFVLWGVVDLVAMSWQFYSPHFGGRWAWPICLPAGVVLTVAGKAVQRRRSPGYSKKESCSRVMSVWGMVGLGMGIYVAGGMLTRFDWQFSYMAAILMMIGIAHGISAAILRWRMQGLTAAAYWAGGVAIMAFNSERATRMIWLLEMCMVMIVFGVYATRVEARGSGLKGARA
jgi:hypothetical protein